MAFSCGSPPLDDYLKTWAHQDAKRLAAAVFVMVPDNAPTVMTGYYTLSATSVALKDVPEEFARKQSRCFFAPATLLGRLARAVQFPGTGRLLLVDALKRAFRQSGKMAAATVIVDAKDARARAFCESFGFWPLAAFLASPSSMARLAGTMAR